MWAFKKRAVSWKLSFSVIGAIAAMTVLLALPRFAVAETFQISGNVSDAQGKGVANVEVRVLSPVVPGGYGYAGGGGGGGGDLIVSTTTDSVGNYATDVPTGIYDIKFIPRRAASSWVPH